MCRPPRFQHRLASSRGNAACHAISVGRLISKPESLESGQPRLTLEPNRVALAPICGGGIDCARRAPPHAAGRASAAASVKPQMPAPTMITFMVDLLVDHATNADLSAY